MLCHIYYQSFLQAFCSGEIFYFSILSIVVDSTAGEVIHTCDKEQGTSSNDNRVISPDFIMIEDEDEPPIKVPKIEPLLYIEQCKISTMIIYNVATGFPI